MLASVDLFFKKKPNDKPGAIYRAQGRNFFLTYPKCDWTKQRVFDFLTAQFAPSNLVVCTEKHQDGTPHCHAVMQFSHKKDYSSCRWADLGGDWHGYYTTCRSVNACIAYVMKDDDYLLPNEKKWVSPHNFKKEKADWDAWVQHRQYQQLKNPFPFELFDETINQPLPAEKKINWLFIGLPDQNKTLAIQSALEGKKAYTRTPSTYPYDDYNDEDVIVFDDHVPAIEEIINVSNCYKIRTPVWGNTRYSKRYWKMNQRRVMLIICNPQRIPTYWQDDAFQARFNIRWLYDDPDDDPMQ